MSKLAIVCHSAHGHTEHIARQVRVGATDVRPPLRQSLNRVMVAA